MKTGKIVSIIFTIIGSLCEIGAILLMLQVLALPTRKDKLMAICFIVGFLCCLGISIWSFYGIAKNQKAVVGRAILMKMSCIFFTLAVMYAVAYDLGLAATILFGFCGTLSLLGTIYVCYRYRVKARQAQKPNLGNNSWAQGYSVADYRKYAEQEYRKVNHKSQGAALTESEYRQIEQYASLPIRYFLRWLIDRNMMSNVFYDRYKEQGQGTALIGQKSEGEILSRMGGVLSVGDVAKCAKAFFIGYTSAGFGVKTYSLMTDKYFFDYYEAVGAAKHRFFCMDESNEDYRKLAAVLDQKYTAFTGRIEPYEKQECRDAVSWNLFGKQLDVNCCQRENETVSDDYIESCKAALNAMPERTIIKMFKQIKNDWEEYISGDEPEVYRGQIMECFMPDEMLIYPPKDESQPAFVICGEASFEEEHGIAVVFRDGELLDISYRMDHEDPFSVMNERLYRDIVNQCDRSSFGSSAALEAAVLRRELIETEPVPENLAAIATGSGKCYLTPYAYEQKCKCDVRLEALCATRDITKITYEAIGAEPIPQEIRIRAQSGKDTIFQVLIPVSKTM